MVLRRLPVLIALAFVLGCGEQAAPPETDPDAATAPATAEAPVPTPEPQPEAAPVDAPAPAPQEPAADAPRPKGPEYYVALDGEPVNPGTKEAPWDIISALGGKQKVEPGATIYIRGGTYRKDRGTNPDAPEEKTVVTLVGEEGKITHVRPVQGERVVIDGGLQVQGSRYLWMWDLELLVSEPTPTKPVGPGSHPADFHRPWGGLNVSGEAELKFIDFLIHDNRQGVSWWSSCGNSELYGAIIYDNGWPATDRGHGHCIYTQNQNGVKAVTDCILTCKYPGTYTMHAYGSSRAFVDNYVIEGNIAYGLGTFLVGGGKPSRDIVVRNNALHNVSMQIGYNAPENENCTVTGNVIVNGGLSINRYKEATQEDNLIVAKGGMVPAEPRVFLRPNKYDPTRAHLAIYNFAGQQEATVDAGALLKDSDEFALQDPKAFYGPAVHAGKAQGGKITVPMAGREFGVYVLLNMSAAKWQMLRVFGKAEALYAGGKLEEALKLLADAGMAEGDLATRMRTTAANAETAQKAAQAGDVAAARKAVDAVLAAEPRPDNVYRKSVQALAERLDAKAAEFVAKGKEAMKAGDLPAAAAAFKESRTYAPADADVTKGMESLIARAMRDLNLAINFRTRNAAKAKELLTGVLAILPEDHPGHVRATEVMAELAK